MKTIYTCLPIYDKVSKQCFRRATVAKTSGYDKVVPTVTSRHRLPSFQWLDDGDGAASVSTIELMDINDETYNGDMRYLNYVSNNYDTFVSSGLNVTSAIVTGAANKNAIIGPYYMAKAGEIIRVKYNYHRISGAVSPYINFNNNAGLETHNDTLVEGENEITYTITGDSVAPDGLIITLFSQLGPVSFTFTGVEIGVDRINQLFVTLPALYTDGTNTWFTYDGDTLNHLLPEGLYYLKITMNNGYVYYSEWFLVDCVFENLITAFTN